MRRCRPGILADDAAAAQVRDPAPGGGGTRFAAAVLAGADSVTVIAEWAPDVLEALHAWQDRLPRCQVPRTVAGPSRLVFLDTVTAPLP